KDVRSGREVCRHPAGHERQPSAVRGVPVLRPAAREREDARADGGAAQPRGRHAVQHRASGAAMTRTLLFVTIVAGTGILSAQGPGSSRPIRLEPGLVIVSAINDAVQGKDYEAVGTVQAMDASGVSGVTDWAMPDRQSPDGVRRQSARSMERAEDAQHARRLILWYQPGDPETIPGATGPTPSVDVFTDIQTKGEAAAVIGAVSASDGRGLGPLGGFFAARKYFRGTVKKLGVEPVRVLLDGVPASLNAVHVGGTVSVAS